jgi:hypothetical protein
MKNILLVMFITSTFLMAIGCSFPEQPPSKPKSDATKTVDLAKTKEVPAASETIDKERQKRLNKYHSLWKQGVKIDILSLNPDTNKHSKIVSIPGSPETKCDQQFHALIGASSVGGMGGSDERTVVVFASDPSQLPGSPLFEEYLGKGEAETLENAILLSMGGRSSTKSCDATWNRSLIEDHPFVKNLVNSKDCQNGCDTLSKVYNHITNGRKRYELLPKRYLQVCGKELGRAWHKNSPSAHAQNVCLKNVMEDSLKRDTSIDGDEFLIWYAARERLCLNELNDSISCTVVYADPCSKRIGYVCSDEVPQELVVK